MGTLLLDEPEVQAAPTEPTPATSTRTVEGRPSGALLRDTFKPEPVTLSNVDWVVAVWMTLMHLGCIAAPFYFSWSALGVCLVLYWLTGTVGICLGYHRYLAHRSFKLARPVEFFVYWCGAIALQGSPLIWASTHRVHHARSDKEGDPHSPRDGVWWSHILWLFIDRTGGRNLEFRQKIVPDLMRDPMIMFFEKTFFYWTVLLGVALFAIGGLPWLLWGLCVRMVITYHATWFVNSATHIWGYRTYETTDDSKNLWWVALLTGGEGWHNNHHAYPRIARAGHKWWEFDPTYMIILGLKKVGLAWDVNDELPDLTRRATPPAVSK